MSLSRIYKTNPELEVPSTTVKIVYDDEEIKGEELPIEELSLDDHNITVTHTNISDNNVDAEKEISRKQQEADAMLAEAQRVLEKAKADAEQLMEEKKQEAYKLRDQIIDEGIRHVEEKQQEGYNAGFEAHALEINQVLKSFNTLLMDTVNSLKAHDKEYIDSVEESLRGLSIQIAEKILRKNLDEDPLAMSCLTFEILDEQKKSKHVNVVLSNQAKELADSIEQALRTNEEYQGRDITVETRDVSDDTLLVENDSGTVDASIRSQLKKLKEFFDVE